MLATLLPIDPNFARLKPLSVEDKWGDRAEWDFFDKRRQLIGPDEPKRTFEQYFSTTLWPHSDIDLFVYGMTEVLIAPHTKQMLQICICLSRPATQAEAQKKLLAILAKLRRSLLLATGARHEVYFVKTANTITVTESSSNLAQVGLHENKAGLEARPRLTITKQMCPCGRLAGWCATSRSSRGCTPHVTTS